MLIVEAQAKKNNMQRKVRKTIPTCKIKMCWESVENKEKETLEQPTRKKKPSIILGSHRKIKK